jgi:uncharacterized protein (TIGR02996 family)
MPFVGDDNSEMRALIDGAFDLASEAATADDPADRSHQAGWLVLADWLDDHDDPRAAYLRARVEDQHAELHDWLQRHLAGWLGKLPRGAKVSIGNAAPGFVLTLSQAANPTPALIAAVAAGWLTLGKCNPPRHLPQFTSVRRLTLEVGTDDAALAALKGSDVEILTIANGWTITGNGYRALVDCPRLRHLSIDRGDHLDDVDLAALAPCPNLQQLSLTGCRAVRGARLDALPGLRALHLGATGLRPEALRICGPLKSLERLTLSGADYNGVVLAALPAMPALRSLTLASCSSATDSGMVCLERMPSLERLYLSGCKKLTGAGLARLARPDRLRYLLFHGGELRDVALTACLRPCVTLEEVSLGHFVGGISEVALLFLSDLPQLRQLSLLAGNGLTGEFLAHLCGAKRLETLTVLQAPLLDDHLKHLSALENLRRLSLSGCTELTGRGLRSLGALTRLEMLSLTECHGLDAQELAALNSVRSLRELNLNSCNTLSNDALGFLGELSELVSLTLAFCPMISELRPLANLSSLRSLDLHCCAGITDDALRPLAGLRSLQALHLNGVESLTDRGIAHLGELTNLQTLYLPACKKLTDASLEVLARLRNLQTLNLSYTGKYSLVGIAKLQSLRYLRSLYLGQCGLDLRELAAVQALFPGIRVSIW